MKKLIKRLSEKRLSEMEGLKSEVSVGNIRELLRCLSDLFLEDAAMAREFESYHNKRVEKLSAPAPKPLKKKRRPRASR